MRFLHIRFSENDNIGIWFLKGETPRQQSQIGKQVGEAPMLVIFSDDCEALYQHIQNNEGNITRSLEISKDCKYFHCAGSLWKYNSNY